MREGYGTCFVCVCVRLSVCYRSSCFSVRLYLQPTILRGLSQAFLGKICVNFRTSVEKLWREKANMQMIGAHRQPLSRSFGTNETQQLRESQLVGRMLLQRLATGATGVKQARYNIQAKGGSEALVRACAVYTQRYCMCVAAVECETDEFRRGFRTLVLYLLQEQSVMMTHAI